MTKSWVRGRWDGSSGWGTHVKWLIHVNVWQKPQYCKVISLQLIKIIGKKKHYNHNYGITCVFVCVCAMNVGWVEYEWSPRQWRWMNSFKWSMSHCSMSNFMNKNIRHFLMASIYLFIQISPLKQMWKIFEITCYLWNIKWLGSTLPYNRFSVNVHLHKLLNFRDTHTTQVPKTKLRKNG